MPNWASKSDRNQAQIVENLRKIGYDVDIVSREKGLYDIVVTGVPIWSKRAVSVRVEIKADSKAKLTPAEEEYWQRQKHPDNLIRAESFEDVLNWFQSEVR